MYPPLNLPPVTLRSKGNEIWDCLRKKYVRYTPEEHVRQSLIRYFIDHLGYPEGLMASEFTAVYNGMKKRCDVVVFNSELKPVLIIECKAPDVAVSEDTFFQLARYASSLGSRILVMSNGLQHFCAVIGSQGELTYLENIPAYKEIRD